MGDWQAVETYVILRQAQDERDPPSTLETPSKQRNRSPTKTDDYYTATTNREIYQKISTDYQEIVKQTNAIREGKPLRLRLKYGCCMKRVLVHDSVTAVGHSGPFPPGSSLSTYFPESSEYYGSATFLDAPIQNAVRGRGRELYRCPEASGHSKGLTQNLYHWAKFYMIIGMIIGQDRSSSRLIDEAWAIYVGGEYLNSLAALARAQEANFGREGTLRYPAAPGHGPGPAGRGRHGCGRPRDGNPVGLLSV